MRGLMEVKGVSAPEKKKEKKKEKTSIGATESGQ